ncbi:hypothetical protein [Methanobacterium sp. ACI-7]|uniref:hypothetical protein n=1 Tax=unclassified Methanobacterium TaxID=2627676 RepID=UPI0039C0839F
MEVRDRSTDIMPSGSDLDNLIKWNIKSKAPDLSEAVKIFYFDASKIRDFRMLSKMSVIYVLFL